MSILKTIINRRSIREFQDRDVPHKLIDQILEAGRWAPSGLNNQPWRFVIIKNKTLREALAECTESSEVIESAPQFIAVFLDEKAGYNRTKDLQAIGACIQNMLLTIHDLGLGACWLGEILNQHKKVEKILTVPESYELMAVLAIGYPVKKRRTSTRRKLESLIITRR